MPVMRGLKAFSLTQRQVLSAGDLIVGFPGWYQQLAQAQTEFAEGVNAVCSSGPVTGEVLQRLQQHGLAEVIEVYGEERYHRKIAGRIVQAAKGGNMNTTFDLKMAVSKCVHPRFLTKSLARVFQAIRIKINDELESLKEALANSIEYLEVRGRIAVISFHSIEDRIVKQFFKDRSLTCICPRDYPVCTCNTVPSLKVLTRKAVTSGKAEVENNSRSRSAKLRVAERI